MPRTQVRFYCERSGEAPVLEWLRTIRRKNARAYANTVVKIQRLAEQGHELRRPEADFLRDGIHELRIRAGRVQIRVLYFFHGKDVVVLAHALTKEDTVPAKDIDRANERRARLLADPARHTLEFEEPEDE